jgi:predicted fused transcriptional regulator/phosphomethylpyrimidine kinase
MSANSRRPPRPSKGQRWRWRHHDGETLFVVSDIAADMVVHLRSDDPVETSVFNVPWSAMTASRGWTFVAAPPVAESAAVANAMSGVELLSAFLADQTNPHVNREINRRLHGGRQ